VYEISREERQLLLKESETNYSEVEKKEWTNDKKEEDSKGNSAYTAGKPIEGIFVFLFKGERVNC